MYRHFGSGGITDRALFPTQRCPLVADPSVDLVCSSSASLPVDREIHRGGDMYCSEVVLASAVVRCNHLIGDWKSKVGSAKGVPARSDETVYLEGLPIAGMPSH